MRTFFLEIYDKIYLWLNSPEFVRSLLVFRLASWVVSLFLAILSLVLLKRSDAGWQFRERLYARSMATGQNDKRWQKIQERLKLGDDANLKLAVIEADKLFDDILVRMAAPGRTMDERLGIFQPHELQSIDLVWEAHRLRDFIVRNPKTPVEREEIEKAVAGYESALRELEYLS
jgi:hypothetical protein